MAAIVLPQALCMIPRNNLPIYKTNLGFSTSVSLCSTVLSSVRISDSRVSFDRFSLSSKLRNGNSRSGLFVVRAEAEGEADVAEGEADVAVAVEEADIEAPEAGEDAEVEEEKPPRKPRVKLGDIMGILNKRAVEASENERPIPDLRTGDIVQIKLEVPENKRRLSVYKGIVISKQNAGIHTTIRIRRIIAGIGVEIVFPIYSPNIKEIRVMSHRKVRRARLYYLRDKLPRLSTFK